MGASRVQNGAGAAPARDPECHYVRRQVGLLQR